MGPVSLLATAVLVGTQSRPATIQWASPRLQLPSPESPALTMCRCFRTPATPTRGLMATAGTDTPNLHLAQK